MSGGEKKKCGLGTAYWDFFSARAQLSQNCLSD